MHGPSHLEDSEDPGTPLKGTRQRVRRALPKKQGEASSLLMSGFDPVFEATAEREAATSEKQPEFDSEAFDQRKRV